MLLNIAPFVGCWHENPLITQSMTQLTSQAVESQQNDAIETVLDNADVAPEHEQPHLALS